MSEVIECDEVSECILTLLRFTSMSGEPSKARTTAV